MERYLNRGGNSGVVGYEIEDECITVEFDDGARYLYTYGSAGADAIERMKSLARFGQGLNSFISRSVKKGYARRLN